MAKRSNECIHAILLMHMDSCCINLYTLYSKCEINYTKLTIVPECPACNIAEKSLETGTSGHNDTWTTGIK